jgi:3-oxoacyl-[acyl-carrier-protein] synthase-3
MLDEGLQFIQMDGAAVFKFATRVMGKATKEVCELANLSMDQIDLFIPHQANQRIIASAAKYLKLPDERVMLNVQKYGNTSAASIPIAFCEAVEQKRLKAGNHFVLVAFGAGLSWAACAGQFDAILPESKRTAGNILRRWVDYNVASARSFVHHGLHKLDGVVSREPNKNKTN